VVHLQTLNLSLPINQRRVYEDPEWVCSFDWAINWLSTNAAHLQSHKVPLFLTNERLDEVVESKKRIETCFACGTIAL
jgi:hypothetical protein